MIEQSLSNAQINLISALTDELPVLRARLNISQGKLANSIGISRQTYGSIETGKRPMSWTIFVALIGYFLQNTQTKIMLEQIPGFSEALNNIFNAY